MLYQLSYTPARRGRVYPQRLSRARLSRPRTSAWQARPGDDAGLPVPQPDVPAEVRVKADQIEVGRPMRAEAKGKAAGEALPEAGAAEGFFLVKHLRFLTSGFGEHDVRSRGLELQLDIG